MVELKVVGVSAAVWLTLAISRLLDGVLEGVVLLGAAIAALGVIGHAARKVARFIRRVSEGVDLLFHVADRIERFEARLDRLEDKATADVTVRHELTHD